MDVFLHYFNNFAIGFFVCKCALVSFYTYFHRILTILQISFIFQTPPRPPQGHPQDPLGPPRDPPRTLSDQGRRSGPAECAERLNKLDTLEIHTLDMLETNTLDMLEIN